MGKTYSPVPAESIDKRIKDRCVVIFSTTVCSYCTKTKELLKTMNIDYKSIELDQMEPSEGGKLTPDLFF